MKSLFAICVAILLLGASRAPAQVPVPFQELTVTPAEVRLPDARSRQQLLVTAIGSNSYQYDVTRQVSYTSQDSTIAEVDATGVVRPVMTGKTVMTIRGAGRSVQVPITVGDLTRTPPVSFTNEVMAVLGKAGCNAGNCHGHASGKNGFKLSLRGHDPSFDLHAITRGQMSRRINLIAPESSLILLKATGMVAHGGERRFGIESESHALLHQWLKESARGDIGQAPRLEKIEVTPDYRLLPKTGLQQQLTVRAHFSGGQVRDVTDRAIFELTNEESIEVNGQGLVTGKAVGEGAVLVRFLGKMALSRLIIVEARADFKWSPPRENNFIDKHVFAKLKDRQLLPSDLSSDTEFLRRVSFDAIGLTPTPAEVRAFLADTRPDKRARKIDELLDRPEFADQWAVYWMDLLRADESASVMGRKGVFALSRWLRKAFDRNMPYDEFVRAFVTARGSQFQNPPAAFSRVFRQPNEKAEAIAQLFLGTRLECAQCHDHPFDRWTQNDYQSLYTFFYQVRRKDGPDNPDESQIYLEPERFKTVSLRFLDGSTVTWQTDRDRREALAEWMLGPARMWAAKALVNRVWGKLLGRGIVEPVDDLRFSNPPVNDALWEALAEDFLSVHPSSLGGEGPGVRGHRYNFKHLVRTILNSRTYQLSAQPNASNGADQIHFSHARLRRLTAEQLLDALTRVTGIEEEFQSTPPGYRAAQVAMSYTGSYFLKTFGRPARKGVCTCERSNEPTLPQVLHFLNGATVMKRLQAEGGTLQRLLSAKLSDDQLVEELYLHVLSRLPNDRERRLGRAYLSESKERSQGAEDLLWALLNSRQFVFNH